MDKDYLIVTFDDEDQIDGTGHFKAPSQDAYKAGKARAVIAAAPKFHVYEMDRTRTTAISFSLVPATKGKK